MMTDEEIDAASEKWLREGATLPKDTGYHRHTIGFVTDGPNVTAAHDEPTGFTSDQHARVKAVPMPGGMGPRTKRTRKVMAEQ